MLNTKWFRFAFTATVCSSLFIWIFQSLVAVGGGLVFILLIPHYVVFIALTISTWQTLRHLSPYTTHYTLIRTAMFSAPLIAIDSAVIFFLYNDNQAQYLLFISIIFTILFEMFVAFWAFYEHWHATNRLAKHLYDSPTPSGPQQPVVINPSLASASQPKKRKALYVLILVALFGITQSATVVIALHYNNINMWIHAHNKAYSACNLENPLILSERTDTSGNKVKVLYSRWEGTLGSSIGRIKVLKYYCSVDDAKKELGAIDGIATKHLLEEMAALDKELAANTSKYKIGFGPHDITNRYEKEKGVQFQFINKPAEGLAVTRQIFEYSDNSATVVMPWRTEYSSKAKDGIIVFSCAEPNNFLLFPVGYDAAQWKTNSFLPLATELEAGTFSVSQNKRIWSVTLSGIFQRRPWNTQCTLYDELGLITQDAGDSMIHSIVPAGIRDAGNMVVIKR